MKTLVLAVAALALAGSSVKVSLSAPTHHPVVDTHWRYSVHATRNGRPVTARITVQILDPIGGVHPVQFGSSKKNIVGFRFRGVFRDYVIWPPESKGIGLTFRTIVVGKGFRKVIRYAVTPRA